MAPGQGSKLWVEWCFCSTRIIPEDDKHALGCLERGCQDVRQGPMPAHPTRQLLPARRPSRNNLRWAELSVWSVMYFSAGVKVSKIRDAKWWQRDTKWFWRLDNNKLPTKTCKHYYKHLNWDKNIRLEDLNDAFTGCQCGLFNPCSGMDLKIVLKNCLLRICHSPSCFRIPIGHKIFSSQSTEVLFPLILHNKRADLDRRVIRWHVKLHYVWLWLEGWCCRFLKCSDLCCLALIFSFQLNLPVTNKICCANCYSK